jgi:hypothetical protein
MSIENNDFSYPEKLNSAPEVDLKKDVKISTKSFLLDLLKKTMKK